ncbi:MAG: phage terminase large subunit [Rickettsiaceae bacterium H1]|nr:phage terminase large subunit [Rickettsiaceae bacterium H1]
MNFINFIYRCFHTISPARKLSKNWHIKVIACYLEKITRHKRLIINIPPRCMKSTCVSVAWPAWVLGHNPSSNIIVASYSKGLSIKHSLDTRCIIQSDWYKAMFPRTILSKEQNTKHKFHTTARGFRLATSIGATLTGEGADILIADDPITPLEAHSIKYRTRVIDWFEQMFVSRLNCPKKGAIVVVMHRLHEHDLIARLLKKKFFKWECLSLPMVADYSQDIFCGNKLIYHLKQGEILDGKRYSKNDIELIKQDVSSYAFSTQYQQNPVQTSSGIVKKEYFSRYSSLPQTKYNVNQSWDTASTTNENSSYSSCITYAFINGKIYITEVFRGRINYPQLKLKVKELATKYNARKILIEEKACGIQLLQELNNSNDFSPVIGIKPKIGKIDRLQKVLPLIEGKKIALPYEADWLEDFEEELTSFPNSRYSDQVDSLTQLLLYLRKERQKNMTLKSI